MPMVAALAGRRREATAASASHMTPRTEEKYVQAADGGGCDDEGAAHREDKEALESREGLQTGASTAGERADEVASAGDRACGGGPCRHL